MVCVRIYAKQKLIRPLWRAKQGDQAIGNGAAPAQFIVAAVVLEYATGYARRQRVAHAPVFQHQIEVHALF